MQLQMKEKEQILTIETDIRAATKAPHEPLIVADETNSIYLNQVQYKIF